MYWCNQCESEFEELARAQENHGYFHGPAIETFTVCPCCGDWDVEEMAVCMECGADFLDVERHGFCKACDAMLWNKLGLILGKDFSVAAVARLNDRLIDGESLHQIGATHG